MFHVVRLLFVLYMLHVNSHLSVKPYKIIHYYQRETANKYTKNITRSTRITGEEPKRELFYETKLQIFKPRDYKRPLSAIFTFYKKIIRDQTNSNCVKYVHMRQNSRVSELSSIRCSIVFITKKYIHVPPFIPQCLVLQNFMLSHTLTQNTFFST